MAERKTSTWKIGVCVVPDCLNVYYPGCGTRFHRFPIKMKKKERWLKRLGIKPEDLRVGVKICHLHFKSTDYSKDNLKPYALPSVNQDRRYSDYDSEAERDVDKNKISLDDIDNMLDEISRTSPPINLNDISDVSDDDIGELLINTTSSDDEEPDKNKFGPKEKQMIAKPKPSVAKKHQPKKNKPKTNISKRVMILYPEGKEHNFVEELETIEQDDGEREESQESENSENEIVEDDVENVLTLVCRTCLATGCKMYSIKQNDLEQAYIVLTGICSDMFEETTKMPRVLCFECAQRLKNYVDFSTKSITSSLLLMGLIEENKLTIENIKSIDREQNLLTSTLSSTRFDPNHFDVELKENECENKDFNKTPNDKDIDVLGDENEGRFKDTETTNNENSNTGDPMDIDLDYAVTSNDRRIQEEESDQWEEQEEEKEEREEVKIKRSRIAGVYNKEISAVTDDNEYCTRGKKSTDERMRWEFKQCFIEKRMTEQEKRQEIENRKNGHEYINAKFRCDKCFRGYKLEISFTVHMKRHSTEAGEFICDICHVHFKTRTAVSHHCSNAHTFSFSCRKCPFVTPFRNSANLHKNYHDGFRFQCRMCPKFYTQHAMYLAHKRLVHTEDCVCHLCGSSFALTRDLERHLQMSHKEDNLHLLSTTNVSPFGRVRRLETPKFIAVSYVTTLPEDSPHCSTCDIRFRDEEALNTHLSQSLSHGVNPIRPKKRDQKHMRLYSAKRKVPSVPKLPKPNKCNQGNVKNMDDPVTCEQCREVFVNYRSYASHFTMQHPYKTRTQYPANHAKCQQICDVCGKVYQTLHSLKNHLQSHSGIVYPCDKCKKKFPTKNALFMHKMNHTHSRQCNVCGKTFRSISGLAKHMRIHTHKPYSCEICEKRYNSPSAKHWHIRHKHMGVPWPRQRPKGAPKLRKTRSSSSSSSS